jgi:molecular chaperone GrpE
MTVAMAMMSRTAEEMKHKKHHADRPEEAPDKGQDMAGAARQEDAQKDAAAPAGEKAAEKPHDYLEDLQRLQAEFDNFRKRSVKEKQALRDFAIEEVLAGLLPVVDNFQRAMRSMEEAKDVPAVFRDGVQMIYRQFLETFRNFGVTVINSVGEKFDPNRHEAVGSEESDGEDHIILREVQQGYAIGERIIRPAAVVISVAKKGKNTEKKDAAEKKEPSCEGQDTSAAEQR